MPIDFVICGWSRRQKTIALLARQYRLADPAPLTTHQLFAEISKAIGDAIRSLPRAGAHLYPTLMLPAGAVNNRTASFSVPYSFCSKSIRTRAVKLIEPTAFTSEVSGLRGSTGEFVAEIRLVWYRTGAVAKDIPQASHEPVATAPFCQGSSRSITHTPFCKQ